ncbi:MAG: hypothetical protein JWL76_125 [Thermoleophilia bacterium]|nr:hypothetical protein [Thermoleophilia bacterium]
MPAIAGRPARGNKPTAGKPGAAPGKGGGMASKLPGKRRKKGAVASPRERIASAAAPLHDRRRRLVGARETTLRDLGGLMLEMYKRNRFREELLLDKCEEVLAIEVEIAHVDQRLFQLAPPNAAGMRPIGRCECGAPIHPGQNFCGVCGRSFATLTQVRSCQRCGAGLRPGDSFCATCGSEAPDALQTIEAAPPGMPNMPALDATAIASSAVAETLVMDAPPLDGSDAAPGAAPSMGAGVGVTPPSVIEHPTPAEAARTAAEADVELPPIVLSGPPIDAVAASSAQPAAPEPITPAPSVVAAEAPVTDAGSSSPVLEPISDAEQASGIAASEPMTEPAGLAQPAPSAAPAGFDWSTPPAAPDAAMDAAVDAIAPSPTDPETPFAGFPLSATVPPPPIVDPIDVPLMEPVAPFVAPVSMTQPEALPVEDAPAAEPRRGRFGSLPVRGAKGDKPAKEPKAAKAPKEPKAAKPAKAPKPPKAVPGPAAPTAPQDSSEKDAAKAAKAAEREAKKALVDEAKHRERDAKLRAKAKAKAAREQRKRGGGS